MNSNWGGALTENSSEDEPLLVLCHSFFHDGFRLPGDINPRRMKTWMRYRFLANFIIFKSARLPEGRPFAVTSARIFEKFMDKFLEENPQKRDLQLLNMLEKVVEIIDKPSINKLSEENGILAVCETLYSRSKYEPIILVTSIESKDEDAENFYEGESIPFDIYDPKETMVALKTRYPSFYERTKNSIEDFDASSVF